MMFDEALVQIMRGASVRRESWWPSKVRVAAVLNDGFNEPFMFHRTREGIVPYPLSLGRDDWFAADWIIVDDNGNRPSDKMPPIENADDPGPVDE